MGQSFTFNDGNNTNGLLRILIIVLVVKNYKYTALILAIVRRGTKNRINIYKSNFALAFLRSLRWGICLHLWLFWFGTGSSR